MLDQIPQKWTFGLNFLNLLELWTINRPTNSNNAHQYNAVSCRWAPLHDHFQGSETLLHFLTVADCLPHMAVLNFSIGVWACRVAVAHTWNNLSQRVSSAPSVSVFWGRLKAFQLFFSVTTLYSNFCSSCTVTVVTFRHLKCSFLLTFY